MKLTLLLLLRRAGTAAAAAISSASSTSLSLSLAAKRPAAQVFEATGCDWCANEEALMKVEEEEVGVEGAVDAGTKIRCRNAGPLFLRW